MLPRHTVSARSMGHRHQRTGTRAPGHHSAITGITCRAFRAPRAWCSLRAVPRAPCQAASDGGLQVAPVRRSPGVQPDCQLVKCVRVSSCTCARRTQARRLAHRIDDSRARTQLQLLASRLLPQPASESLSNHHAHCHCHCSVIAGRWQCCQCQLTGSGASLLQ